jgi:hypothetical protein
MSAGDRPAFDVDNVFQPAWLAQNGEWHHGERFVDLDSWHPERVFLTVQHSWHPADWGEDGP